MSLARDITTVGSGTLMSRLLAYLRDAWIAALLGAGPQSEAFFAVLQVVNFFRRLLSEGALNSAFAPIWLKLRAGDDGAVNANRFTWRVLLAMFCIAGFIALLVIFVAPAVIAIIAPGFDRERRSLAAFLLFMVAPYFVLVGLVAVIAAALNAEGRVAAVALSTILFNLAMIVALAMLPHGAVEQFYATAWLAFAISVAGFAQLALTMTVWLWSGKRWQRPRAHSADQTETFFRRALPGLIAAGMPQLKLIAITAIASASPAAVSWLYYANRLYELPLGVVSVAIAAVIVPRIASSAATGDDRALAAAQSRAYEVALGLALPAAVGFALLAHPIAGGLFERGAFGPQDTVGGRRRAGGDQRRIARSRPRKSIRRRLLCARRYQNADVCGFVRPRCRDRRRRAAVPPLWSHRCGGRIRCLRLGRRRGARHHSLSARLAAARS